MLALLLAAPPYPRLIVDSLRPRGSAAPRTRRARRRPPCGRGAGVPKRNLSGFYTDASTAPWSTWHGPIVADDLSPPARAESRRLRPSISSRRDQRLGARTGRRGERAAGLTRSPAGSICCCPPLVPALWAHPCGQVDRRRCCRDGSRTTAYRSSRPNVRAWTRATSRARCALSPTPDGYSVCVPRWRAPARSRRRAAGRPT